MITTDLPTLQTVAFVQAHLSCRPARILEVGCGNGAVAARLQSNGHGVVAIDSDSKAIASARERGVDAQVASWPDFNAAPFDMVLFTRSLHHIKALREAVNQAKQVLKKSGRVLVEDFAFEEIDALWQNWLYSHLARLDAAGLLRRPGDGLAEKLLQHHRSHEAFHCERDHELHTAPAMLACLRDHFSSVDETTAPYLYRYVCSILEDTERGYAEAAKVLELEKRFAETNGTPLIGRRFVARGSSAAPQAHGAIMADGLRKTRRSNRSAARILSLSQLIHIATTDMATSTSINARRLMKARPALHIEPGPAPS